MPIGRNGRKPCRAFCILHCVSSAVYQTMYVRIGQLMPADRLCSQCHATALRPIETWNLHNHDIMGHNRNRVLPYVPLLGLPQVADHSPAVHCFATLLQGQYTRIEKPCLELRLAVAGTTGWYVPPASAALGPERWWSHTPSLLSAV